jgi:hypothetical protein
VAERKLAARLGIFHEIRDGSTVRLPKIAVLEELVSHNSGVTSVAEVIDEPEDQADADADDEAGDEGEIEGAVFAAVDDVAGEMAEAERKFWSEVEESADDDKHCAEGEEQAAKLLGWFHVESLAREG